MDFEIHHELLSRMPENQINRLVITSRRFEEQEALPD